MGPPWNMRSVVDRNVVMQRIPILPIVSINASNFFLPAATFKRERKWGGGANFLVRKQ